MNSPDVLERAPVRDPQSIDADNAGPYVVILYNCDCHTWDQVITQLQRATGCSLEQAGAIAYEAHTRGRAIAYSGPSDECNRAAAVLRSIGLQCETDLF